MPREPFVSGDKELDRILRTFPEVEVRKAVRKATRNTLKNQVLPDYRQRLARAGFEETGATRDVAKVRSLKRSRVRYGTELRTNKRLVIETRRQRGGRIGYDKKRKSDFFHPVAVEFGDQETPPERPLFRALKENTQNTLAQFRKELRLAITAVGIRAKLRG